MYFGSAGSFVIQNNIKFGSLYKKYKESNLAGYKCGDSMIYTYNIFFIIKKFLGNDAFTKFKDLFILYKPKLKYAKLNYGLDFEFSKSMIEIKKLLVCKIKIWNKKLMAFLQNALS